MSRFLSTFVCAALLTAGCGTSPNEPDVPLPITLTLQPGQSAVAGGLFVKFVEVSDDFRCPINAVCVSAGDALLEFDFSTDGRFEHKRLQVFDFQKRFGTFEAYKLEVKELTPARDTSRPMSASEYKVTLVVSR